MVIFRSPTLAQPGEHPGWLPKPRAWTDGAPVTLKAASSPLGRFIATLIFAAVWNGIVSVFVVQVVKGFVGGKPDFCMTLFMVPFVLVGLLMLGMAAYFFMGLFNPRIELSASSDALLPGEPLDVAWSLSGRSTRVHRLHLVLEGREEATYRRGTSTSTDKHVICTLDLADVNDPLQVAQGAGTLTIPADAMHSFESSNNKIVWMLKAKGEIPGWPDVSEEFKVVVLPAGYVKA